MLLSKFPSALSLKNSKEIVQKGFPHKLSRELSELFFRLSGKWSDGLFEKKAHIAALSLESQSVILPDPPPENEKSAKFLSFAVKEDLSGFVSDVWNPNIRKYGGQIPSFHADLVIDRLSLAYY